MKTVKRKYFLGTAKEKAYLDKMNADGYELVSAAPFTYVFEKTDRQVNYEYVMLKHGKRSYLAFNYKERDPNAKAVYANGDCALFKKAVEDGEFTLFSDTDEKRLNRAQKKTSFNTNMTIFIALTVIFITLGKNATPSIVCAVLSALLAITNYFNLKNMIE